VREEHLALRVIHMKTGMKLNEFTPVITEYEDASGFPDE
jgi:hypothetical protein